MTTTETFTASAARGEAFLREAFPPPPSFPADDDTPTAIDLIASIAGRYGLGEISHAAGVDELRAILKATLDGAATMPEMRAAEANAVPSMPSNVTVDPDGGKVYFAVKDSPADDAMGFDGIGLTAVLSPAQARAIAKELITCAAIAEMSARH